MKFQSKYLQLRLVVKPTFVEKTNFGVNRHEGVTIEFKNGEFETEDKKLIAFVQECDEYKAGKIIALQSKEEQEDALLAKAKEVEARREAEKPAPVATKKKATKKVAKK